MATDPRLPELLWLVVALPLAGAVLNAAVALARPALRWVPAVVGPGVVLGAFGVAVALVAGLAGDPAGAPVEKVLWAWLHADRLQVDLAFRLDRLSAVLLLVVTGVGGLIHVFSVGYMRADPGVARYFAWLNLFVAAMLVLVLGASLPVLFLGWEGVGLCSYLLIGFWYGERRNADAATKAFVVNRIGDLGLLLAMFLLWWAAGTFDIAALDRDAALALGGQGSALATLVAACLFVAVVGKSAQLPLHVWLPDAMAGPTPVSALIHAATMVTAGVYLVARLAPVFALAPATQGAMALVGGGTALFAALVALRQDDIKKVLAFSTVSQLGYMVVGVATGAHAAGLFHLVTHACFKALLFLGAGAVIHALHHAYHAAGVAGDAQDLRAMGGLRHQMPWTAALMTVATLAIAGIPPLAGFWSKDEVLGAAFARGQAEPAFLLAWALGLAAAACTAFYMARWCVMAFWGGSRLPEAVRAEVHEAPAVMRGPLVVLGLLTVAGGALNLPAWAGGHHALDAWLAPALATARAIAAPPAVPHAQEAMLVGLAVLAGVGGLAWGWRATLRAPVGGGPAEALGIGPLLERQFHVDALYHAVVVRGYRWLAGTVLDRTIDRRLIDGFGIHGLARAFRGAGWVGSRIQTGQVGMYVLMFVVGVVLVLRTVFG